MARHLQIHGNQGSLAHQHRHYLVIEPSLRNNIRRIAINNTLVAVANVSIIRFFHFIKDTAFLYCIYSKCSHSSDFWSSKVQLLLGIYSHYT